MQYRPPNTTLDSGCQTVSIVTYRWSHLSDIVRHSIEWCAGDSDSDSDIYFATT